jgi:hypothetical protein
MRMRHWHLCGRLGVMHGRALKAGCAVVALSLIAAAAAHGYVDRCHQGAGCATASADGSRVAFDTFDALLPADKDRVYDVYELVGGKRLRLLTPDSGNDPPNYEHGGNLRGASRDGRRVIIETITSYSPLDPDDRSPDVYILEDGVFRLVTDGDQSWSPFLDYSADARHLYFGEFRSLVPEDTDRDRDLYEWADGTMRLVSTGPTDPGNTERPDSLSWGVSFNAATEDGSAIYFSHGAQLTSDAPPADGDFHRYVRRNGSVTEYLDLGRAAVADVSPDGSLLYLYTDEQADPADTDSWGDVYVRASDGTMTLVSRGPTAGGDAAPECVTGPIAGCSAFYVGSSRAGDRVFFSTAERMTAEDNDFGLDLYERHGSTTTLLTPGTPDVPGSPYAFFAPRFLDASDDGTQVAISTKQSLVRADRDKRTDIYVRTAGRYHLVSTGPATDNAKYDPVFADFVDSGDSVIFFTRAPLVEEDTDKDVDVYERVIFKKKPGKASAVAAGKGKRVKKGKARGKTKLISAERIPPRIRIGAGRVRGGTAQVRIRCPKREESGCRGRVRALGAGSGRFALKRGRGTWVSVGGASAVGASATVVVKARDGIGNRAKARKRVRF